MNITLRITHTYGTRRVYPVCEKAKLLARLTNSKTFSAANLENIRLLGYDLQWETRHPLEGG